MRCSVIVAGAHEEADTLQGAFEGALVRGAKGIIIDEAIAEGVLSRGKGGALDFDRDGVVVGFPHVHGHVAVDMAHVEACGIRGVEGGRVEGDGTDAVPGLLGLGEGPGAHKQGKRQNEEAKSVHSGAP